MVDEDKNEEAEWDALAQRMANDALPYRVTGREWETALLVAKYALKTVDNAELIPLEEALTVAMRAIEKSGLVIVRAKETKDLLDALDEFGMNRDFQTDSVALKRAKTALRLFRLSKEIR